LLFIFEDCQDLYKKGTRESKLYTIYGTNPDGMLIWCDFDHKHGWTVIQRRLDGTQNFYKNWKTYAIGFGSKLKEYWIGIHTYAMMFTW